MIDGSHMYENSTGYSTSEKKQKNLLFIRQNKHFIEKSWPLIALDTDISNSLGYYVCICHTNVFNITVAWSLAIFPRHFSIRQNGANACASRMLNASTVIYCHWCESSFQLTCFCLCPLSLSAYRSTETISNMFLIWVITWCFSSQLLPFLNW